MSVPSPAVPLNYEYYQAVYESSPIGIALFNASGILLHVNPATLEIFGIANEEDVIGFQLFDNPNFPVDALKCLRKGDTVAFTELFDFELVKRNSLYSTSKSGVVFLDVLTVALKHPDGHARGYLVQVQDVTEREQAKKQVLDAHHHLEELVRARTDALRQANLRLQRELQERQRIVAMEKEQRTLADALRDTVMALSSKLTLCEVIDQMLAQLGKVVQYDAVILLTVKGEYIQRVYSRGFSQDESRAFIYTENLSLQEYPNLIIAMAHQESVLVADTSQYIGWVSHEEIQWIASNITVPIISKDMLLGFINVYSKIPNFYSEKDVPPLEIFAKQAAIAIHNARLYENMQRRAIVDELTGLYNRRGLYEVGVREVSRVQRFKRPLTAIFLDIDHFKQFNDRYSYKVGDMVLRFLSKNVQSQLRDVDILSRYGGEEFVALLPEIALKEGVVIAERLCRYIAETTLEAKGQRLRITVSIGVAPLNARPSFTDALAGRERELLHDLIDRAGKKLHIAKESGRNCVSF